jgi:hypothetical protein
MGIKRQRSKMECDNMQKLNSSKYLQQKISDMHCEDDKHCVSAAGKHSTENTIMQVNMIIDEVKILKKNYTPKIRNSYITFNKT